MGTPIAPSAVNIFMGWLEEKLLAASPVSIDTSFWKRFIDDILMIWMGTQHQLDMFREHLNSFHPTIKFTMESSKKELPFLDILIKKKNNYLTTDLHTKATDKRAYLPHSSCHPRHCRDNIPYSQLLRARRLCSVDQDFTQRSREIMDSLRRRGYKQAVLSDAMRRVSRIPREELLRYRTGKECHRVPFVITHNPAKPPLRKWLREQQVALHRSPVMRRVLPEVPVIGERNPKNLRALLMPSVLPPHVDSSRAPGVLRCAKMCVTCREHLQEAACFSCAVTGESFQIRHYMTCTTSNVVYLLYCRKCPRSQYVGETGGSLKTRFALHRSHIRQNVGTLVTRHFNQPDHCLQDMRCLPIEKQFLDDRKRREGREKFWMKKLRSHHPTGLNDKTK